MKLKCINGQTVAHLSPKEQAELNIQVARRVASTGETPVQAGRKIVQYWIDRENARANQRVLQVQKNLDLEAAIHEPVLPETGFSKFWNKITLGSQKLFDEERQALAKLFQDLTDRVTQGNFERKLDTIVGEYNSILARSNLNEKVAKELRRNKQLQQLVVAEKAGRNTGNAKAKSIAKAFSDVDDYLRNRHQKTGGFFSTLIDWVLPHSHDRATLLKVGKRAWIDEISPMLDRRRMVDWNTNANFDTKGLNPVDAAKVDQAFDDLLGLVYDSIITGGVPSKTVGAVHAKRRLANRFDNPDNERILHFKNTDDWFAYNEKFGTGDVVDAHLRHWSRMAKDISLMELFGPDPDAGIEHMKAAVDNTLHSKGVHADRRAQAMDRIDGYYNQVTGRNAIPASERFARFGQGTRNLLTSSQLGSAILLSFGDFGTAKIASNFYNVPFSKVLNNYFHNLSSGAEGRAEAARMGLVFDEFLSRELALIRQVGHVNNRAGWTSRLAEKTMSWSGLEAHTDSLQLAWAQAMSMEFAEMAKRPHASLPDEWKRISETWGITDKHWDVIRQSRKFNHRGIDAVSPTELLNVSSPLARDTYEKVYSAISAGAREAIYTSNQRAEFIFKGGKYAQKRGTIPGELMASFAQYKRFPALAIMHNMVRTFFNPRMQSPERISRIAQTVIFLTIAGYIGLQLRNISNGKDPEPMSAETIGKAFITGGGGGPVFDLMGQMMQQEGDRRMWESLVRFLAGPQLGVGTDIFVQPFALAQSLADAETDPMDAIQKFGQRASHIIQKNFIPGQSIWYVKLALQREVFDQFQLLLDPKYHARQRDYMRKLAQEGSAGYWWEPTTTAPERGPNLGQAFEGDIE